MNTELTYPIRSRTRRNVISGNYSKRFREICSLHPHRLVSIHGYVAPPSPVLPSPYVWSGTHSSLNRGRGHLPPTAIWDDQDFSVKMKNHSFKEIFQKKNELKVRKSDPALFAKILDRHKSQQTMNNSISQIPARLRRAEGCVRAVWASPVSLDLAADVLSHGASASSSAVDPVSRSPELQINRFFGNLLRFPKIQN